MKHCIPFIILLSLLSACSPNIEPSPTADIDAIVAATVTAREQVFYQPRLLSPEDNASLDNPVGLTLSWQWLRPLEEGEHFDVRVWREGEPAYGIAWADQTSLDLSQWLTQQEPGEFFWTVAVIRGIDGAVEATVGEAPAPRRFTLTSNQLPTATPTPEVTAYDIASVPQGFEMQIFTQIEDAPTAITAIVFDTTGDLLALALDGRIYRIHDTDGDGLADELSQILFNLPESPIHLEWAVGMALYQDRIYVSDKGRVSYLTDDDSDGIYETQTVILEGLPSLIYNLHSNNGIVFGPDAKLYLAIGSTTDHGPLDPDYPYESSILRMNPDGSELEVYAHGFRNPFDLSFAPDGRLFAGDNGADIIDSTLPFYTPEELNEIVEGGDYGFPDFYGNGFAINDSERETIDSIVMLPSSSVTSGITYYNASAFPENYRDGVYIAQFGGFRRTGRAIVFVPLTPQDDGAYNSNVQAFMDFHSGYNPIDVMAGPDGALYVVEWTRGYILRITYVQEE